MSMQDKELDQLFRNKLEQLTAEPATRIWEGIAVELDGKRKKNNLIPFLRIAAVVTIFLSAGVYFLIKSYQTPQNLQANITIKRHRANPEAQPVPDDKSTLPGASIAKAALIVMPAKHWVNHIVNNAAKGKAQLPTAQPAVEALAEIDASQAITNPQLMAGAINTKSTDLQQLPVDKPTINSVALPADGFTSPVKAVVANLPIIKPHAKKHGIRSLGDLINVVVARVDKRENKVIEFTDTDDDQSVLTGVNLGIIRVKKDR